MIDNKKEQNREGKCNRCKKSCSIYKAICLKCFIHYNEVTMVGKEHCIVFYYEKDCIRFHSTCYCNKNYGVGTPSVASIIDMYNRKIREIVFSVPISDTSTLVYPDDYNYLAIQGEKIVNNGTFEKCYLAWKMK